MAEALLQDMVNKKAHWPSAQRIYVTSASTLQIDQQPATDEAIQVMYEKGLDIGSHRSRHIDGRLVDWSDVILVIEDKHKNYILEYFPNARHKVHLITEFVGEEGDVPDPTGRSIERYRQCADRLASLINKMLRTQPTDIEHLDRDLGSDDRLIRWRGARALSHLSSHAKLDLVVPRFIQALSDEDRRVREIATYELGRIGSAAKAAVPALIKALSDENRHVRHNAIRALGQIGLDANLAVPSIVRATEKALRYSSIEDLRRIGAETETIVPLLVRLLKSQFYQDRRNARDDLCQIGEPAISKLIEVLRNEARGGRAGFILASIGKASVPAVTQLLKNEDDRVMKAAADVLGEIGSDAEVAVPDLIELLTHQRHIVRTAAADALVKIDSHTGAGIHILVNELKKKNGLAQQKAAATLGHIGPVAEAAVPNLIEALKDIDNRVRTSAAHALVKVSGDATAAIPILTNNLKVDNIAVRRRAVHALGEIGPKAKTVIPALARLLKDRKGQVRQAAVVALGKIDSEEVVPYLIPALVDYVKYVRETAFSTLVEIGEAATPGLLEALENKKRWIRLGIAARQMLRQQIDTLLSIIGAD